MAEHAVERLRPLFPKWKLTAEAQGDSPAWALIKKADQWRADLILVGSQGRSTLERLFLGSVSQKVAAEAHCSVRIARPRKSAQAGRFRVVVAVDGSDDSQAAVRSVAARTWPELAEFSLVTVMDPRLESALAWPDINGAQWVQDRDTELKQAVLRMVESSARCLHEAGSKVETNILQGDPKRELLRHAEAWEADAIFLGARGQHHGERLALGTLASAVAARAHCSVEIVRPG
jgi:nucleotide-binding universal stress UspA family protein